MPRTEIILNVFVASPSDVEDERKLLDKIVFELNKCWSNTLGLRLEIIKWETDVYAGFSDYPQNVINEQVNGEYDIFIGIFWSRVGTETKKEISGSIEEFEIAYKKFKSDKESIDLLLYFKDEAINPSKMDINQLMKLKDFKERVSSLGSFYSSFLTTDDFEAILRTHLSRVIQKWAEKLDANKSKYIKKEIKSESNQDANKCSFEGYLDEAQKNINVMRESLLSIYDATNQINTEMRKSTESLNSVENESNNYIRFQAIQNIINEHTLSMNKYSNSLNEQIEVYSSSKDKYFDNLVNLLSKYESFDINLEKLNFLRTNIEPWVVAISSSREHLVKFKHAMSNLPRTTTESNLAKNRVVTTLENMLKELDSTLVLSNNILKSINQIKLD